MDDLDMDDGYAHVTDPEFLALESTQ
jgi:hypothetical protein